MAINASTAAAEMPDILGIQLGMPAREAHAKLQAELPKNKIQVMSTNLPTIEKPVMASFVSAPTQNIMMGMVSDRVTADVTLPPNKQSVWRIDRSGMAWSGVVESPWWGAVGSPQYKFTNKDRLWCVSSYTAVFADVSPGALPELYDKMYVSIVSLPMGSRAGNATLKWKNEIAEGKQKQDIEKAKQQEKPKL